MRSRADLNVLKPENECSGDENTGVENGGISLTEERLNKSITKICRQIRISARSSRYHKTTTAYGGVENWFGQGWKDEKLQDLTIGRPRRNQSCGLGSSWKVYSSIQLNSPSIYYGLEEIDKEHRSWSRTICIRMIGCRNLKRYE